MTAWPAMRIPVVIAILLISTRAIACELSLVAPATSVLKHPVEAFATLANDTLTVHFSVSTPSLNAKQTLAPGEYPYQFDVVELFVTFSSSGFPYFEFEVSPYNQTFQVRIISTKEHQEGVDLGLTSAASIVSGGWNAEMKIPLKPMGWDGDCAKIRGNFYSTLGKSPRSYWSAFLPKAAKPNFHQPQYFKPLLTCG
jgi:Carbohydrate family 9 binding domain-like